MRTTENVIALLLITFLTYFTGRLSAQPTNNTGFTEHAFSVSWEQAQLHGTITLPETPTAKMPVALIIAGSGATDRNGNNPGQGLQSNSYKMMAHFLAQNGIASLRYDKRNVGESKSLEEGKKHRVFLSEVADAQKIMEELRKDARFEKIYVLGHSQGSLIGILAAEKADKFVSLAGIGRKGNEILKEQLSQQPPLVSEAANPIIDSLAAGHYVQNVPSFLEVLFKPSMQPYLISWFGYDPAEELAKLNMPRLIIQGEKDVQIPVSDAKRMAANAPGAQLFIVPDMNHNFKTITGGREENLASYTNPDLPNSPAMHHRLLQFLKDN
ncbi:MAG: alpha/beta hydrolase [Chitinophagaceae bacterium]